MTAIAFADETTVPIGSDSVIPDITPEVSDIEFPCVVCGKEAGPYGGRGRKPTRCSEHKKSSGGSTRSTPRVTGTNATLAAQATEALCSIDGILQLGTTVMGFTETASVIADADEVFRMRVHAALINSPDTCRKILRYGSKAGDSALFIAILLHVATIAPVFVQEAKTKKAERAAIKAAEEAAAANAA